ncbi:sugar phosphate isomerase/epimerase [Rubellicoccus peritrichatus]|uniref:Sugar phosphate isomerase/epimerase n=1 Tax=Rubellicoccus peritrichatus TaxID=3080537 RepID=A0AAQ3LDK3_9BACT|nr:sugar phosphate isomerase/epimerase [Puniceicoccus sp. CR14]WOO41920.1 sugar phosphate isomerase/epimerase [Puniceicoccus sp. CR14]
MSKVPKNFFQLAGDFGFDSLDSQGIDGLEELRGLGFHGVYPQDLFCTINRGDDDTQILFESKEERLQTRSESEVEAFAKAVSSKGLTLESSHFNQTLQPPGEPVEWIFPRHEALVNLANVAGLDRITTHIGWMYGLVASEYTGSAAKDFASGAISLRGLHLTAREAYGGLDAIRKNSLTIYRNLCDEAAKYGITVTVETSCIEVLEINTKGDEIRDFIKDVGRDNLAVCLDPGHCLWNGVSPVDLARDLGSLIVETHFHDNNGDHDSHMPLGTGSIDWLGLAKVMLNFGYKGIITFEQKKHATNMQNWFQVLEQIEQNGN